MSCISCVICISDEVEYLEKGVAKIQKGYIVILSDLCNEIKKTSTKFCCIGTLKKQEKEAR